MVDNVVRKCLVLTVEDQTVAQEGLGINVGICLEIFYVDNSMFGSWDSGWLKNALNVTVGLF